MPVAGVDTSAMIDQGNVAPYVQQPGIYYGSGGWGIKWCAGFDGQICSSMEGNGIVSFVGSHGTKWGC